MLILSLPQSLCPPRVPIFKYYITEYSTMLILSLSQSLCPPCVRPHLQHYIILHYRILHHANTLSLSVSLSSSLASSSSILQYFITEYSTMLILSLPRSLCPPRVLLFNITTLHYIILHYKILHHANTLSPRLSVLLACVLIFNITTLLHYIILHYRILHHANTLSL